MAHDPIPTFASPLFGSEAVPLLTLDGLYAQEPIFKGAAVSFSADPNKPLDLYHFGHPSAVPELLGIMNSTPRAPGLQSQGPGYEETLQVVPAGRCGALLAPGQTVRRGQFLEPVGAGAPGLWRVSAAGKGPFQAWESVNNSGTQPIFVSGLLLSGSAGGGLFGMSLAPSAPLSADVLGANTEGAFDNSFRIPKNTLMAGKKYRLSALVDFMSANPGDKTILGVRLGGLGGLLLATTDSKGIVFAKGDQGVLRLELDVQTTGLLGRVLSSGTGAIGTLGAAPMVAIGAAGPLVVDTTKDYDLSITVTFNSNNAANQAVCRTLSLELVN